MPNIGGKREYEKIMQAYFATLVLVIIGTVGLISYNWDTVSTNLKMTATEKILDQVANNVLDLDMDVSKAIETLDNEEKKELVNLITSYATETNVKKLASYVSSGDISSAKTYVKNMIKEEDVEEVMELYQAHESEIKSYIGNPDKIDELMQQYGY